MMATDWNDYRAAARSFDDGGSDAADMAARPVASKHLQGGSGNDIFYGGGNDDYLNGGGGNDRLYGYGGNDEIRGGPGNDRINGGANTDNLWGGKGADNFVFDNPATADRLMDFRGDTGDTIDLHYLDANVNRAGQQDFIYMGNQAFSGRAGELIYGVYGDETWVMMDRNGDAKVDAAIFVNSAHYFSANDFIL